VPKRKRIRKYTGPDVTSGLDISIGDAIQIRLMGIDYQGLTKSEWNGAPLSVMGGIPGELVTAKIIRILPEKLIAKVFKVDEASEHRVEPPCKYFLDCTGCQWQHISYDQQLELKSQMISEEIQKRKSLNNPSVVSIVPSPLKFNYRNHARFTVSKWPENMGQVGFMNNVTRRFVKIDECLLMDPKINEILKATQGKLRGHTQISVRTGQDRSFLIQPKLTGDSELTSKLPSSGQSYFEDRILDRKFRIASPSFFQVNSLQMEQMVKEVVRMFRLNGEGTLLDAYSGVGVFAVLLSKYVNKVISVEESASSIQDALFNSFDIPNIEFIESKVENIINQIVDVIDYVLLDPPRTGCLPEVLEAVSDMNPRKVILVSCDSDAFVRDVEHLVKKGFRLIEVRPVDMFPQTRHIEILALLECAK